MTAKTILLRAAGMVIGGVSLLMLGGATVSAESRLWMAPVLLGVVLLMRTAYDLQEFDGWLASSTVAALAFFGMTVAAFQSLAAGTDAHTPEWNRLSPQDAASLQTTAFGYLALGLAALLVASWRATRALRAERPA